MKIHHMNSSLDKGGAAYVPKTLVDQISTNIELDITMLHWQDNKVNGHYHGAQSIYLRTK